MQGNIYIDEDTHIYHGVKLFDIFFELKYKDLESHIKDIEKDVVVCSYLMIFIKKLEKHND
jgi:hypothetical protein